MKKVIIGVIIGILVMVGIASLLLKFVFGDTQRSADQATRFVQYIANTDTANAYEQFSPKLKDEQDKATFDAAVGRLELDASCELTVLNTKSETSTDEGTTKTVTGQIRCNSKKLNTANFIYGANDRLIGYEIR